MTSSAVSEIPILEWIRISCECVSSCDSLLVSLPLRVLLSALACIRNDRPISFRMACAKSIQLTMHPTNAVLISAGQGKSPLSSTFTRQEELINVTQSARCAFPRHWVTMQVSSGSSVHVFLSNISTPSWHVKSASVGNASLYDKHFVANIRSGLTPVMYCSCPTTALNNEC